MILRRTVDVVSSMVKQYAEVDKAQTELRKVTNLSDKELEVYSQHLGELGTQVARTKSSMIEAATEFAKSGFSTEDSAKLALTASLLQNVADENISAGDAANFLVSQMTAFNKTAEDSEHIVDALNSVSNNFAVSSGDLTKSLPLVASALSVGGNSMEEMMGLMVGATEITRNSSRAARGLVSVQSRLNQVVDESSSTGQKLSAWYKQHNIELYDQQGELRSLYDVLGDVANQWSFLDKNQKDYFLNIQAGEIMPLQCELLENP